MVTLVSSTSALEHPKKSGPYLTPALRIHGSDQKSQIKRKTQELLKIPVHLITLFRLLGKSQTITISSGLKSHLEPVSFGDISVMISVF